MEALAEYRHTSQVPVVVSLLQELHQEAVAQRELQDLTGLQQEARLQDLTDQVEAVEASVLPDHLVLHQEVAVEVQEAEALEAEAPEEDKIVFKISRSTKGGR